MQIYDLDSHVAATGLNAARAARRATYLASLGPIPRPAKRRPLKRNVIPLLHPVDIHQHVVELVPTTERLPAA